MNEPLVKANKPALAIEVPVPPTPLLTPEGLPSISDWTLEAGVLHVNHGSFGGVPALAQAAQAEFRRVMESNPDAWFHNLTPKVQQARHELAAFLGIAPDETALVPNASAGASVVFNNVPAWRGMKIVTTDHTYGAVQMGAQRLAKRWGGRVEVVHVPLAASEQEAFALIADAMTDDTALVVIDQVTSATAKIMPAALVAAEGRKRGIPVLVDAAHAPGIFAEPLAGIDADFWVGNLHKFACAPRGTAVIVARGEHTQLLFPLIDSWGGQERYPERFDQQGTIDATAYLAAPMAVSTIETRYGWHKVREYAKSLSEYAQNLVARELGDATGQDAAVSVGRPVDGLRLIRLPSPLASTPDSAQVLRRAIASEMSAEVAITSWNGQGFLRLSSHVYNTAGDFEEFVGRVVPFIAEQARSSANE